MGCPHEKNPNSVNITLKKEEDNEDLFGEEGYGGKRRFVGNRGVGDWGEVEKYTGFYHRISNSDEELSKIIAVLFFLV